MKIMTAKGNIVKRISAILLCLVMSAACALSAVAAGPGEKDYQKYFDPEKFELSADAGLLVVAGGLEGTDCRVYVFERVSSDAGERWECVIATDGKMGRNGMSNYRHEGDGTTPIGVWQMNTPFGQKPAEDGFPKNYVQVGQDHVWSDKENRLMLDPTGQVSGERVGTARYAGYYDYVIDAGYNRNAVKGKGSALFLHCLKPGEGGSSGCVKIPTDKMKLIMKLYGKYGDGKCYMAQAPLGSVSKLYDAYGVCGGLSPDGSF